MPLQVSLLAIEQEMQVGPVASSKCAGGLGSYFSMNIMVDWIREKHGNQMNRLFF